MHNKSINVIMEFIMNSIDCIVYIVIVFTGNMHRSSGIFVDSVHITIYNVILQFIYC